MTTSPEPRSPSSPNRRVGAIVALVAVVAVAGAGAWILLGGNAPAAVSLGTPLPTAAAPSSSAEVPGDTADPASPGAPTASADAGSLSGTWAVDASVGSFDDFSGSFVGYRVQEELATIGTTTAVGRTPDVTGSLAVDGTVITSAEVTADLTTLRSDDGRRDNQLRRQALETDTFPTASFRLAEPIDLGAGPAEGATFEATAVGDLTLHGETRRVELPLQGRLANGVVTVVGSLEIAFADYGIDPPRAPILLAVDEVGVLELQLHLTRS